MGHKKDMLLTEEGADGKNAAFTDGSELYGKKLNPALGNDRVNDIDTNGEFYQNVIQAGESGQLDVAQLENFTTLSRRRDTVYRMLETMADDCIVSAILETYAEDCTEVADNGRIVWSESDDGDVNTYITYLLDTINVDKYAYKWIYSLCKYGDLYLKLFRESEFNDGLFDDKPEKLEEDVILKAYSKNDKFVHYLEQVPDPAEMFELTKFGKSYAYVKANLASQARKEDMLTLNYYKFAFKKKDVEIYEATNFVHATLDDNTSRVPETVSIYRTDSDYDNNSNSLDYNVRRGQSLLTNSYKIWRELMLLENSMLLNRLTKSSIIRIIGVEVGDMPKENVGPHLMGIKSLIEQKASLEVGSGLNEYNNPGPIENNVYVPTHGGIGAIQTQEIGGDVNVTGLGDIEYFKNRFYGSLSVPKMYFGDTDDATGFNGGTSLTIISSRYARTVRRIQNTFIQALTDAINIMLLDKGLDTYVNKFQLHMQPPTTQEDIDRNESLDREVGIINNIMMLLDGVEDPAARLKILKSLLSGVVSNPDVMLILEEQIEALEEQAEEEEEIPEATEDEFGDMGSAYDTLGLSPSGGGDFGEINASDLGIEEPVETGGEVTGGEEGGEETVLPMPSDLGMDFSDSSQEF